MERKIIQSNEITQSDWTINTLRIHLMLEIESLENLCIEKFKHLDEMTKNAVVVQKEALSKAETANEKRFESVNEFRATLSDQTASFIPRAEFLAMHNAVEEKVNNLKDKSNIASGYILGAAAVIGIIVTIGNIAVHFLMKG